MKTMDQGDKSTPNFPSENSANKEKTGPKGRKTLQVGPQA